MNEITFHFYRSTYPWWNPLNISAGLIRIVTNSYFNHTSIQIGGQIWQSKAFKGVIRTTKQLEKPDSSISIKVSKEKQEAVQRLIYFLDAQLGKGYDYACVLGFLSAKPIQHRTRLFCSELVNVAFSYLIPGLYEQSRTLISPKDLYNRVLFFKKGMEHAN